MIPRFIIDTERRVVEVICGESVTAPHWRAALREVTLHPEFQPRFGLIVDCRHLAMSEDNRAIASAFSYLQDNGITLGRVAVVARDLPAFGLVRAVLTGKSDDVARRVRIVWTPREASAWVIDGSEPS